jgi:hypothetical protein
MNAMTDDIVERLRAAISETRPLVMCEAADEIERLRLVHEDYVIHANANVCSFDREIERLRAALESLLKDPPPTLDEPDTDAEVIVKMRAIAREALTNGQRADG